MESKSRLSTAIYNLQYQREVLLNELQHVNSRKQELEAHLILVERDLSTHQQELSSGDCAPVKGLPMKKRKVRSQTGSMESLVAASSLTLDYFSTSSSSEEGSSTNPSPCDRTRTNYTLPAEVNRTLSSGHHCGSRLKTVLPPHTSLLEEEFAPVLKRRRSSMDSEQSPPPSTSSSASSVPPLSDFKYGASTKKWSLPSLTHSEHANSTKSNGSLNGVHNSFGTNYSVGPMTSYRGATSQVEQVHESTAPLSIEARPLLPSFSDSSTNLQQAHTHQPTQSHTFDDESQDDSDFSESTDGLVEYSQNGSTKTTQLSTECNQYATPLVFSLIAGFNHDNIGVQPGGKRSSPKDTLPTQVIELTGFFKPTFQCRVDILGYNKKRNMMQVIGKGVDLQPFEKDEQRYLATFSNCCCRFSSHAHGQKLALRFVLMDQEADICHIDSRSFQTITRRGREKQNKKMTQKGAWSWEEIQQLLEGVQVYGVNGFPQIHVQYQWKSWQTPTILQKKYMQLLKP